MSFKLACRRQLEQGERNSCKCLPVINCQFGRDPMLRSQVGGRQGEVEGDGGVDIHGEREKERLVDGDGEER